MIVTIIRYFSNNKHTLGKLYINEQFNCYTLEDVFREKKIKKTTRIPAGKYKLALRFSPKFTPRYKHPMIWIKNVPQFEWILFHPGNTHLDTDGCILVGQKTNENGLVNSRYAYNKIYSIIAKEIEKTQDVTLQIFDLDL